MRCEINGLEELGEESKILKKSIKKIVKALEFKKKYTVNISLVDKKTMKDLCLRFKNKSYVTDVLSFPMLPEDQDMPHFKSLLGDIVICVKKAEEQAFLYGHSLSEEIAVLTAHGLWHLLGLDHERSKAEENMQMQGEMFLLEKAGFLPELSLIGRV